MALLDGFTQRAQQPGGLLSDEGMTQMAGLLSQLPTFSGRPNPVQALGNPLLQRAGELRQQRQQRERTQQVQSLLGQAPQEMAGPTQSGAPMVGGGSGLLGGEIAPAEFYANLLGVPGYEQIGAQGLAATTGVPTGDAPASVREFEYYQNLAPEDQRTFQTLRRGSQFQDLGNAILQYGPDGSVVARYEKNLAPSEQPEVQGQQEGAKIAAREEATKTAEFPKTADLYRQLSAQWESVDTMLEDAIDRTGVFTAGAAGTLGSGIAGTPQYDFAQLLDSIKANIGFDKLQQMRDASPTGGALGQVSEMENRLLQAVQGSLEIGQSPAQLRKNLQNIRERLQAVREAKREAFIKDRAKYGETDSAATGGAGEDGDTKTLAPPEAVAFLRENPDLAPQFRAKYGYLPEGF